MGKFSVIPGSKGKSEWNCIYSIYTIGDIFAATFYNILLSRPPVGHLFGHISNPTNLIPIQIQSNSICPPIWAYIQSKWNVIMKPFSLTAVFFTVVHGQLNYDCSNWSSIASKACEIHYCCLSV